MEINAIPVERIESAIFLIRGQRVMIGYDLAALYEIAPRALMQAVKRKMDRFPGDFMFQLTWQEARALRSQIVILDKASPQAPAQGSKRGLHAKYPPYAFTEQGVAMLSSVLNSPRAVKVNIEIMRAFVHMRRLLVDHADLRRKVDAMERKYDAQFKVVFKAFKKLIAPRAVPPPKRRQIGFHTNGR